MRPLRSIVGADTAHPSHCSSRLRPHFSLNSRSLYISWPHSRYLCSDFHSDSLGSVFIFSALGGVVCKSSVPFLWELRCPLKSFICSAVGSHSCTWSCLQSTREPQGPHLCAHVDNKSKGGKHNTPAIHLVWDFFFRGGIKKRKFIIFEGVWSELLSTVDVMQGCCCLSSPMLFQSG